MREHQEVRNLGAIASEVSRIQEGMHWGFEERRAFHAPSECDGLIAAGAQREIEAALAAHGLTPHRFAELIEERTSSKWAYFSELSNVCREDCAECFAEWCAHQEQARATDDADRSHREAFEQIAGVR